MRILQVCSTYHSHIGGVAEHVRNISERLARKYDVTVFATDPIGNLTKEEVINGVKVRRFKTWAPNKAYYFSKELKKSLISNSKNYDIVHAHNYHVFPALYAALAKSKNKFIFSPHYHGAGSTLIRSLLLIPYKFLGKKIFEKADKIICVSNYEKNLVMKRFRVDERKVAVIPNGINPEEFKNVRKGSKDCRFILYVGRLEKYKEVQYLIKALPKLSCDIILQIVGKGPYKESLIKLTRKLGVEDRVKLFQDLPRDELLQKYADADLFVLLSKHEAYGMSVAEALAAGTPCMVANTSALKEWIDNSNCFGVEYPIDVGELATLAGKAIGKRVNGVRLPTWDEVVESIVRIYVNTY